jgi:hypothetical protein
MQEVSGSIPLRSTECVIFIFFKAKGQKDFTLAMLKKLTIGFNSITKAFQNLQNQEFLGILSILKNFKPDLKRCGVRPKLRK